MPFWFCRGAQISVAWLGANPRVTFSPQTLPPIDMVDPSRYAFNIQTSITYVTVVRSAGIFYSQRFSSIVSFLCWLKPKEWTLWIECADLDGSRLLWLWLLLSMDLMQLKIYHYVLLQRVSSLDLFGCK